MGLASEQEVEESGQEGEAGDHAGGQANGHDDTETLNALVFGQDEAAEAGDGSKAGDENGFTGGAGEDTGGLFFGEAVEDVNTIGDPDAYDEGECHDVSGVQGDMHPGH